MQTYSLICEFWLSLVTGPACTMCPYWAISKICKKTMSSLLIGPRVPMATKTNSYAALILAYLICFSKSAESLLLSFLSFGVLQGSVLDSLMFTLYISSWLCHLQELNQVSPLCWISLPPDTRNSLSLFIFRFKLKTDLFNLAFPQ